MARGAGARLDAEVYHLAGDTALVLAAYLADHRAGSFALRLPLAPALTELALRSHGGRPYVLGRWQAAFYGGAADSERRRRWSEFKRAADSLWILNRGSLFSMSLKTPLGWLLESTFRPGVRLAGALFGSTLARPLLGLLRVAFLMVGGPARGRGRTAQETPTPADGRPTPRQAVTRALTCVNCGECNTVCPIFHHSGIRLPQMLTHVGEALAAGRRPSETGAALLDLCMRCGNCEEVCQAGIPHLPLYGALQGACDAARPRDVERHETILATLRESPRYREGFLRLRRGGYVTRAAASLPGLVRFLLQRAENEDGPAATCIHCGACVPVCPTGASAVLEEADRRLITTDQRRCIGCGTCVEVCPANLANGGQTLRVVEAPTLAWVELARALAPPPAEKTGPPGERP
jgi:ferredoxin